MKLNPRIMLPPPNSVSPFPKIHPHTVTYATKQLTQALQELTSHSERAAPAGCKPGAGVISAGVISAGSLQFSKEVENFLEQKQAYTRKTRDVSVGSY